MENLYETTYHVVKHRFDAECPKGAIDKVIATLGRHSEFIILTLIGRTLTMSIDAVFCDANILFTIGIIIGGIEMSALSTQTLLIPSLS